MTLILILIAVFFVSLISLIGAFTLAVKEKFLNQILILFIGFSAGGMLGGAFFHLLPESMGFGESIFVYVIIGLIFFFLLESFLHWRHCHRGKCDIHPFTYLILVGDGVHNFVDGMIIAVSFMSSTSLGLVTTIAVITHEIPQELGDFGALVYGGFSKKRALFYNFLSALTAFAGALFVYFFSQVLNSTTFLLPFAAGGFIYIATTDLIPELHKARKLSDSMTQFAFLLLGLSLMGVLRILSVG